MPPRRKRGPRPDLIGRPSADPNLAYRLVRLACGLAGRLLFRIRVTGLENLPLAAGGQVRGGWICCGLPHRSWVEPFALLFVLPARPRLVMLADGPTVWRSWWRRLLVSLVGGVVPVWPASAGSAFRTHVAASQGVIRAGAVLCLFPEVGPPARPPALRRLSAGVAHFARRTRAPVVPVVFGGTHELFLRRRIEVRIMPPIEPPPATCGRDALAAWMARLRESAAPAAVAAHQAAELGPARRKRWRWLTGPFPRAD